MTKYYDGYGRRVPSPRDDERPSELGVTVVCIILIIAIAAALTYLAPKVKVPKAESAPNPYKTSDCMTLTYTDDETDPIKVYVITDPDTNIQYIVSDHGGICRRETNDEV